MDTRLRLRVVGLSLLCAYCSPAQESSGDGGSKPKSGSPPNIVFVLTDDLAWDLVQYMPAVQALQQDGMTFTRYFVTDSLCCPSRSAIFTGKYPHDTHVFTNTPPLGGYATFERFGNEHETFAVALKNAGYTTGMMGKYLNGYLPDLHQADPGWDDWDVAGMGYDEFNYSLNENGHVQRYGTAATDYLTDVLSGKADRFVRGVSKGPFVLEVATFAPHEPYTPAPRYVGAFDTKAPRDPSFDARNTNPPKWLRDWPPLSGSDITSIDKDFNLRVEAVQAVDDLIDSLRASLVATGLDRNTYFVFSSDNGYHMGQHMLLPGKQTAFDTDIRVPLIIAGPGIRAGAVDDHIVENIDLCPTFADLAGTPPPETVEGHTLVPLLKGAPSEWRSASLVEHKGPDVAPVDRNDPDEEAVNGPKPTSYEALRMENSVYVLYDDGEEEYYDHGTDPYERDNIVSSLPKAQVSAYRNQIANIEGCHSADDCWKAQQ